MSTTTPPADVHVTNQNPLPVKITGPNPEVDAPPNTTAEQDRQTAGERDLAAKLGAVAPPTATAEDVLHSAGQRRTSATWELIHGAAVLLTLITALFVFSFMILTDHKQSGEALVGLGSLVAVIISPYMQRTNHTAVGGVGGKTAGTR